MISVSPWDASPCIKASLDDLNAESMQAFARLARLARNFPLPESVTPSDLLTHMNVAAHFAYLRVLRGFEARMSADDGSEANSAQIGGALFAWIASSSISKSDFPASTHRPTSVSMFDNVNFAIRV